MKRLIKDRIFIYLIILLFFYGCFIGLQCKQDFFTLYKGYMGLITIYQPMILASLISSYIIYKLYLNESIILRYKSIYRYHRHIFFNELLADLLLITVLNLPILLINISALITYWIQILAFQFFFFSIISFVKGIVRICDLYIFNRIVTIVSFWVFLLFIDVLMDLFGFNLGAFLISSLINKLVALSSFAIIIFTQFINQLYIQLILTRDYYVKIKI